MSDKCKVHDVNERRDVTQTYVAEPCSGRRPTRHDVSTALLRQQAHVTGDVTASALPLPPPATISDTTPSDNEREESYSDTDSDPYIFRDRDGQCRRSRTASIGDVGDSGVDDIMISSQQEAVDNNMIVSTPSAVILPGACGSLSSGTGTLVSSTASHQGVSCNYF